MSQHIKPEWLLIHEALHSGAKEATVHNVQFEIVESPTGLRQVRNYPDPNLGLCLFTVPAKNAKGDTARRVIAGETLTWVVPRKGDWVLIDTPVKKKEMV